jgi:hypothetical protein
MDVRYIAFEIGCTFRALFVLEFDENMSTPTNISLAGIEINASIEKSMPVVSSSMIADCSKVIHFAAFG